MKSSAVIACLSFLFCVFGFSSCVHSNRGLPFVSQETRTYLSARGIFLACPRPTTPLGTASANGSTKPFGGLFGCYWTDVVFPRLGGRCWPKLFTSSDRSSAYLQMKRPTKDCFVFLGDPWMVWHHHHGCWRPGLCCCVDTCEIRAIPFAIPWDLWKQIPFILLCAYRMVEKAVFTSDLAPYPPAHNGNADPANTDSLPESDGVCGDNVGDVAADEADGVGENDESSVPEDIACDSERALPRRSTRSRKPPDRYGFNVASIWTVEIVEIRVLSPLSRNVDCCHDRSGSWRLYFTRVLNGPPCCCLLLRVLELLFVSADGNCSFMLIKA